MDPETASPTPTLLAHLVSERHWTQADFCRKYAQAALQTLGEPREVSPQTVSRWLGGKLIGLPHPAQQQVLKAMFKTAPTNLFGPPTQEVVVPAAVGQDEVATVRAVTAFHRRLDAAAGGGRCLQSARGYVAWATRLLQVRCNDVVGAELRAALAELHNLVGWVAHDLDDHDMARRHLTQSLVLARQTDSLPLLANTLYRLGRVSLHQEQPAEALQLFGLGQLAAQQAGCHASVGILHANSAWAYALLGADHQVVDSLTRARRELDQADLDTAPAWTHFALTEADVHGISAVVYSALARHPEHVRYVDRAAEHSHQAVRLRRPQDRRSFIFDTISVATASILAGDLATAGEYGMKAVGLVADGMRSARVNDRLNALWELAAPQVEREPALAALGSRLAELQAV